MAFVGDKETMEKVKNLGIGGEMSSFPHVYSRLVQGQFFTSN
jgi:hypothetical protein